MISISLTPLMRRLRRRMLALVAATVTGLALVGPAVAHADYGSPAPTPATTSVVVATPASASWGGANDPDSASWGGANDPDSTSSGVAQDPAGGGGVSPDSASWG